ncbi:hypothetical protein ILUMI_03532 [Ignelater luminosus]|uniref:PiggyBac transposable element-derived protein domain-containing protein n=1 Tax=Ignelater luminosus TaxID=2038154 RepID=A0A8K0GJU9_IGNLU|nr:hypothetical protein ILUMI_03532 [Ignelater luminosus]
MLKRSTKVFDPPKAFSVEMQFFKEIEQPVTASEQEAWLGLKNVLLENDNENPNNGNIVGNDERDKNKTACEPNNYKNFVFNEKSGAEPDVQDNKPSGIFQMFLTDDVFRHIVSESELYAQQHKNSSHLMISRYLHANNNVIAPQKGDPDFDKIYKIRPIVNRLNKVYKEAFSSSRHMSVDESMIGFKLETMMKSTKRGFKLWVFACAKTGQNLSFKVYESKTTEGTEESLRERTVFLFVQHYYLMNLLQKANDKFMKLGDSDFVISEDDVSILKWRDRRKKLQITIGLWTKLLFLIKFLHAIRYHGNPTDDADGG